MRESMFALPESTQFEKRIPKQKFYANLSITPALKRVFTEQIDTVTWRNKLSAQTLNVAKGERVEELEIFLIKLRQRSLDNTVLELIDREIPYHIFFLLEFVGEFQARIGYKEAGGGRAAFKVDAYYQTDWLPWEKLPLSLSGLNLDAVYENFVRQVAGEKLAAGVSGTADESLKDIVARDKERQNLLKQIAALENKVRREKQFNKQVELNEQLKKLQAELDGMAGR
ncbi:conserved hypothetical protein [uncultured delta proteobacterium]|uniref:Methyl-accepting chemotaxis protein n=1 Tax=uncultured delta proteobacterium TaxID=34034 RepID=A0A212K964_9DELT|nr:conserved hypothetical protein [uncultured delta proteobacterium]